MTAKNRRLREVIAWQSIAPYLFWRAGMLGQKRKEIRLVTGEKLILRPPPTTDLGNAMEVFLFKTYQSPLPLTDVRHIVDLGANIGCSVVYFAVRFPAATIDAFEPHPVHLRQLRDNVAVNRLQNRVTIHPYAVGAQDSVLFLTNADTRSKVVDTPQAGCVQVSVIDWFRLAAKQNIDLLKMDIEGGEYDLVFDRRFEDLRIPQLVVEWHCEPDRPHGDKELADRLTHLGYELHHYAQGETADCRFGMVWAFKHSSRS